MRDFSSSDRRGPKGKHIEPATEFGKAVQEARLKKGLTTPELAELVGVSDASITQTEAGQTLPRKPTVKSYEHALGVSLMPLWERETQSRKAQKAGGASPRAARATKQPVAPRTLKPETFQKIASLGTEGKTTPEGAEKLAKRVKKHEAEIVKEIERRERRASRKAGGKKK